MPINASPEYYAAEAKFIAAQTDEEKIRCLEEAIKLAQLKKRLSKLKKESETRKKKGYSSRGIKKTGNAQAIIIGSENSGKSSLLSLLTNAKPRISELPFTTTKPELGTLDLEGLKIQIVEIPANTNSEIFSSVYGADLIIILVTSLEEIIKWTRIIKEKNVRTSKIVVLNKIDSIKDAEMKKINALKDILKISTKTRQGINELKQKIFDSLELIRVYTKEPGKKRGEEPMILKEDSTINDMAKKIHKDYPKRFIKAKVWGLSAKFDGQIVGIEHKLCDKDTVEMYLR